MKGKFPNGLRAAMAEKGYGLTQLAKAVETSKQNISRWRDEEQKLPVPMARKIAVVLDTTAAQLLLADEPNGAAERSPRPAPEPNARPSLDHVVPDLSRLGGPRNVPVFGTSVGGGEDDSDFEFNGETIDNLPRPASIAHRDKVYAMYVEGESMWPKYEPGDPIYVDPSRAPRPGEYCVVEVLPEQEGGRGKGFIKRLVRRTPTKVIVEQFNPRKELEFEAKKVRLHRVIPWPELLGV
jgi:phage repressor protein C with HTH and peptisase S24 domain